MLTLGCSCWLTWRGCRHFCGSDSMKQENNPPPGCSLILPTSSPIPSDYDDTERQISTIAPMNPTPACTGCTATLKASCSEHTILC